MLRQSRKVQHIEHFLHTATTAVNSGFADVHLLHDALANFAFSEVVLFTEIAGIRLENPVIINAITGGDDKVLEINRNLADCAKKTGCAMAVGSQYAAIKDKSVRASYQVVREINPQGIIFANLGAYATVDNAKEAVAMIGAQALQIHLNIGQELLMKEGDRDFTGYLDNIKAIVQSVGVPVIVKETGCGISFEAARELIEAGVQIIDVSGVGGTNFLAIEASRTGKNLDEDFLHWGIPTAVSIVETKAAAQDKADIIASGGIITALEAVKALCLGAKAVGMAGAFLQVLLKEDQDALYQKMSHFLEDMKKIMLLTGSKTIDELDKKPRVITGCTRQWLETRGFL